MIYMDKNTLERRLHLNMTLIGGFFGGYAILNHSDLFGSAQTGNMISLAMTAVGHPDEQWLYRILGLLIYIAGLTSTVFISHRLKPSQQKHLSIVLDGLVLFAIGFLPADLNIFVATFPIFFATAFQWCTFKGADGYTSSCIFSTNNLRQCTTSFAEYLCSHDPKALHKGKYFGKVLFFFHVGVAFAFISCRYLGLKGSWVGIIFAVTAISYCYAIEREPAKSAEAVLCQAVSGHKLS